MNIIRKELRFGLKPLLFWLLGSFLLIVAGITKFTAMSSGADLSGIFDAFPKIILSVLGMAGGVDFTQFAGFYSILVYYVMICAIIYGIYLGASAVNRELIDRTSDFIFTKPRSRKSILIRKFAAGMLLLLVFCMMTIPFSLMGMKIIHVQMDDMGLLVRFAVALLLVGFLFFSVGAFLSVMIRRSEKGMTMANLVFLLTFAAGVGYDMQENLPWIKVFAPMRYFEYQEVIDGRLAPAYVILCLVLGILLLTLALVRFEHKDLNER